MIRHLNSRGQKPSRVVIAGAAGFVGGAVADRVERDGVPVLRLSRREVDLLAPDADSRLKAILRKGDAFVAAAARAPCRNGDMLVENMKMAAAMAKALAQADVAQVVNISSDAVYADQAEPLTETSCASPGSIHGAMHLAREVLFQNEIRAPLAILRPSLLYGAADPHNGYGPNRFRRQAAKGEDIVLFGEGEERRDHVFIDDIAELVARVLYRRSVGVLNVATGEVHSFMDIARKISGIINPDIKIKTSPRRGPMPHDGYRPFDPAVCRKAFPDFRFTPLEAGLKKSMQGTAGG
jgi:nucleoside-diphosphate-sugar epimerase